MNEDVNRKVVFEIVAMSPAQAKLVELGCFKFYFTFIKWCIIIRTLTSSHALPFYIIVQNANAMLPPAKMPYDQYFQILQAGSLHFVHAWTVVTISEYHIIHCTPRQQSSSSS